MQRKRLEPDADHLPSEISDAKYALEEISKEKLPVVFNFQATRFFEIPSDRLQEWEELLKERIGIPKEANFNLPNNARRGITCCPCCDDCGYAF